MSSRAKAIILVASVVVLVWIGTTIGNAVDNLGAELDSRRAVALNVNSK